MENFKKIIKNLMSIGLFFAGLHTVIIAMNYYTGGAFNSIGFLSVFVSGLYTLTKK